jgi:FAD/FMN-containing dehydrogenase
MTTTQSRRQFLQYSSALAISQLPWLSGCASKAPESSLGVDPKAWKELANHLNGPLLRPGDCHFNKIAATWNLRYAKVQKPAGIARCKNADDVRVSLQWAQEHKLPLVARSGGHSYSGYSTTPGLMIDLSLQDSLVYDESTGTATVGAGARNATLYADLPAKQRSVTHGRCKEVGVGGLVLGGGIGFNMRLHGLLIDQLVQTDVMLANGETRRCNAHENAELFWACRGGGGGNFGINTSFTFQTFPVGYVTFFDITWTEKIDEILPAALDLLPTMPDRLGCKLSVNTKTPGVLTINLLGQLVGPKDEFEKLIGSLFRLASPSKQKIEHMPYWDAQKELSEDGRPEYSHERSRYALGDISAAGSRAIIKHMRSWPGTHDQATWKMFLAGEAVNKVRPTDTAYWHRNASMVTSVELNWKPADSDAVLAANEAWLTRFHDDMAQYTSRQCYQNFIDNSQHNYLRAYYGGNLERLVEVKRAVDPKNIFHYPQSIPLKL